METKLWYDRKDKTLSFDRKNWIKTNNYEDNKEDSFLVFSLNSEKYLIREWKDYIPIIYKEENKTVYRGDFLTIYDNPLIYCEEFQILLGEEKEKVISKIKCKINYYG